MGIKKIPTSRLARGFKLAKLTASIGASTLGQKVNSAFGDKIHHEFQKLQHQIKQAEKVTATLSQMKGAAMKLGQILSLHGEHLFPKEVIQVLARLQQHSDALVISQIESVLKDELKENLNLYLKDFSNQALAAASIGQVHTANYHDPQAAVPMQPLKVAVKVQYPGVDQSIDSDIDSLASLLKVLSQLPSLESFNEVIEEMKTVLKLETDYHLEAQNLIEYQKFFSNDPYLIIPQVFLKASSKKVLTTEYVSGLSVQEFSQSTASQAARDFIAQKFLKVFYEELFVLGKVQTDPNFANYKIQWSFGIQDPKLVLLDFGATKTFSPEFRRNYQLMVRACFDDDYAAIQKYATQAGFLKPDDAPELVQIHYELVKLFMEPFRSTGEFDWQKSNLAERIRKLAPEFIMAFKLRPPPKDFIFLNRKITGIYFFCSAINARFNPTKILQQYI